MRRVLGLGAACALWLTDAAAAPAQSAAPGAPTDSAQVHAAALGFLAAFDSLRWEPFRAALAPDVTVFMPRGVGPRARLDGRAAVEAEFRRGFDLVRARHARDGRPGPPTLGVGAMVRAVRVQPLAPGAAVVSFQLGDDAGDAPSLARRSLVFRREGDGAWRVVHWHASSTPRPAGP
jgi:hypothetical protein